MEFQVRERSVRESSELNTAGTERACGAGITVQDCAGSRTWEVCRAEREEELGQREQVLFQSEYVHDGIVQLSEHHKVDGKAGSAVLGGRIAREPGEGVVLLQNEP